MRSRILRHSELVVSKRDALPPSLVQPEYGLFVLFSRLRRQELEREKGKAKLIPPAFQSGMIYHLAPSAQFIFDPVRGRM